MSMSGSVAGFAVRSTFPLRYLRGGDGDPLEVRIGRDDAEPKDPPWFEWLPRPENPFHAKLWPDDERWRLWIGGLGWYHVDPRARWIEVPPDADEVAREERLWGIPTSLCAIERGDHPLHAASLEIDGRAVLLAAPGRFGKTTLATALFVAGHRLLSEDATVCRLSPRPAALPGPAMLRVRPDSFARLAIERVERVGEDPDRIHLAIERGERGTTDPVRIAGVALLREADEIRLEDLDPQNAIQELWALSFKLPGDEFRAACFARVTELASSVPIWNLYRPLRYDALDATVAAVEAAARS
jgi:hypothetical protein